MLDQAHDLRQLAVRRRRASPTRAGRPALLAVAGGKGGVGTTTVGLNLAIAVAETGRRTVFVDADARGADAALLYGVEERHSLADVLAGRRTWGEAMQSGPGGVGLVAGGCKWNELYGERLEVQQSFPSEKNGSLFPVQHINGTQAALAEQLLESFNDGSLDADLVVIDVGNTIRGAASHICRRADAVLMITTPTAAAVMNTFSAIRTLTAKPIDGGLGPIDEPDGRLYLLINMSPAVGVANVVHYRLAWAARRLLGLQLRSAGHLTTADGAIPDGNNKQFPLNFRTLSVDTLQKLLVAESLLSWQRRGEFNGRPAGAIAEPLEMDF
ncbi:MAG: P-loop NTPase [Planctomycetes bacterium]|nr:P-loop NTPase [Planctomycetota bacterium]MCG2684645.1 P-loop NTPase [Planctomycetales bacterium]